MAKRDGIVLKDSGRKYINVQSNDAVYYESVGQDNEHYEDLNNRHANIHIYSDVYAEEVNSGAKVDTKSQSARISVSRKVAYAVCAGFVVVCIILCVVTGLVVYTISANSHRPLEEKSRVEQNETDGFSNSGWSSGWSSDWSNWSPWGQCTASCDCGLKFRYRTCDSPKPMVYGEDCEGDDTDSSECCNADCSGGNDWELVFRGIAGSGTDVERAWLDGAATTSVDKNCTKLAATSCMKHYRKTRVDFWEKIGVRKVKYSLYKNSIEAAYVIFNGTGSDLKNWFSESKVIQSSWGIFYHTYRSFSIDGLGPARRFYINLRYNGCINDRAFTVAITKESDWTCDYDIQQSYPQFLYTEPNSFSGNEQDDACEDKHPKISECKYWANQGECEKNPNFMIPYCRKSCDACEGTNWGFKKADTMTISIQT